MATRNHSPPLLLALALLVVPAAVGVDAPHRTSGAERSSKIALGVDARGALSHVSRAHADAGEARTRPTAEAEVAENEADTRYNEGDFEDRESSELADPSQARVALPAARHTKSMVRREARRNPSEETPSSQLQTEASLRSVTNPCMTEAKSGGGQGNNFASFKLNGRMINPSVGRGFNVLVLSEDWTEQEDFKVFDTCGRRRNNREMFDFLHNLPEGTCIIVAVKDDATMAINSQSKLALENYGATQAFDIGFRNGYVLMGCKGQPKIKEVLVGVDGATPWVCPERCEWGEWADWEGCSAPCGGGEENRTREKAQEGELGGWPCEGERRETRACNEQECPTTTNATTTATTTLMPIFKADAALLGPCRAIALVLAATAMAMSMRL